MDYNLVVEVERNYIGIPNIHPNEVEFGDFYSGEDGKLILDIYLNPKSIPQS